MASMAVANFETNHVSSVPVLIPFHAERRFSVLFAQRINNASVGTF
jgi:hypothetical protein